MVTLEPARCLHAQHPNVRCDRCVVACPADALRLGADGPVVDATRCDDCARCVPACTEDALDARLDEVELRRRPSGAWQAFVACAQSGVGPRALPCAHSLGWPQVLAAHRRGARSWVVAKAPCAGCRLAPRDAGDELRARLDSLGRWSRARGEGEVQVETLDPLAWRARHQAASAEPARRALFRRLAPRDPAPTGRPGLFAVALEATRCSGCLACAGVCPHGAISVERDARDVRGLTLDAHACTGCELCVAACDDGALEVLELPAQPTTRVPFAASRCPTCRELHHRPATSRVACARRPLPPRVLVLEES